jgi:4a-hydroxytetrahydrobiopterin dehydratase
MTHRIAQDVCRLRGMLLYPVVSHPPYNRAEGADMNSASDLASKKSAPLPKGTPALDARRVAELLRHLPGWEHGGGEIARTFKFKNYYETMAFVNAAAWVSHREDHHPDLEVGYNTCRVRYSTHSVGGLSENDFICAAKLESLFRL